MSDFIFFMVVFTLVFFTIRVTYELGRRREQALMGARVEDLERQMRLETKLEKAAECYRLAHLGDQFTPNGGRIVEARTELFQALRDLQAYRGTLVEQ